MEELYPITQYVNEEGKFTDDSIKEEITAELVHSFYYNMLRIRTFDRKAKSLQRQGRLGTYALFEGQEAAQVGSALSLKKDDWVFPTYRDHGAILTFGANMPKVLLYWNGRAEGNLHPDRNIFPPAVPIATQLPHAAGAAWADKRKGNKNVSIAYFGDGATSEGDFHEGMNFASVFKLPVVFFNQNNGYAISMPIEKQMNSKTIAQKSVAYGMPGIRIDGNDIFAVYFETKKAFDRARNGDGPTLIEAVTQRFGAHTTADDPTKYRDQYEVDSTRDQLDPLLRLERFMKEQKYWDGKWEQEISTQINKEIEEAIVEMENFPKANVEDLFDHVFAEMPWPLREQKEQYLQSVRRDQ
ncbi:pyruvate dehydrogenase (acetyl-transferring) E1 component subunit alpha [Sporosarcina ureae]|uniref:Pyruvate dehydrogenase E1 component subunit alpha n=1 Tax=Sporosarcina ureae TaxID=1571 RepID=A0ABN4YST4_SPOUR|nr:pyruvate dehydrogenase (acetyl-transferring) E1 component subunit alpha [Sporosarcina ureae]ARF15089.1 pyruvate dehydrogenase (acetyl-transferring) E1 component subunit alpha [Sporosarcina ureae]